MSVNVNGAIDLYLASIERDPDYDEVDRLIDSDPIELGRRYRALLNAHIHLLGTA